MTGVVQHPAVAAAADRAAMVTAAITQRDDALSQRDAALNDLIDLQRMLGVDKAFSTLANILRQEMLAALHRWQNAASALTLQQELQLKPSHESVLRNRLKAADAASAEAGARLEAEEARRAEAEKLAFEEGKRRRRAEEEARCGSAELARLREGADDGKTASSERLATVLAVRRNHADLTRAMCTWRVAVTMLVCDEASTAARRVPVLEREAHEAAEERARGVEVLKSQLRAAQREAGEATLSALSAKQQRAEALAKAAAEEQARLEEAALAERQHARHAAVVEHLGRLTGACWHLGPSFRHWGRRAAATRAHAASEAASSLRAAGANATLRQQLEATAADAEEHAAAAAAARVDGERVAAAAQMRLGKAEQARSAERRRHGIETRLLLAAELVAVEASVAHAARMGARAADRLGERAARRRDHALAAWALRAWATSVREARRDAMIARVSSAERAAAEEAGRSARRLAVIEGTRARAADVLSTLGGRRRMTWAISTWRVVVDEVGRNEATQSAAAARGALERARGEHDQSLAQAARELAGVQAQLRECERRAEAGEAEAAALKERLSSSEAAAQAEAQRSAAQAEEAQRMEEELQAHELRELLQEERAKSEAERMKALMHEAVAPSPRKGGGGGGFRADDAAGGEGPDEG